MTSYGEPALDPAAQFHVGMVVDDLDAALALLGGVLGYEWCDEIAVSVPVQLPEGEKIVPIRFRYSSSTPRIEVVQSVPGTVWQPAAGSGIHHLGYWSEDIPAHAAALEEAGFTREATGIGPGGAPIWTYHRRPDGPRVELVSRALQPAMEGYFAGCGSLAQP